MTFRLLIECSKDIDELHINFSDGTSFIKANKPNKPNKDHKKHKNQKSEKNQKDDEHFLDTREKNDDGENEIIKPPFIEDKHTTIKVAEELQNLDI